MIRTVIQCDLCGEEGEENHRETPVAFGERSGTPDLCATCHAGFLAFHTPLFDRLPEPNRPAPTQPAPVARAVARPRASVIDPAEGLAERLTAPLGTYPEDVYHQIPSSTNGHRRDPAMDPQTRAPWALRRKARGAWVQYPGMRAWHLSRLDLPQGPISMGRLIVRRAYVEARRTNELVPSWEMFERPAVPQVF